MTDYLALAMAQWEEVSAIMAEELASTVEGAPGGHLFRMEKTPPGPPEKMPGGGRFDSPSPWTPTPTDQGRGSADPLALEPSPGRPTEGEEARSPHSVAGTGHSGDEPEVSEVPGGSEDFGGPAATSKPTKFGRINGELYRQNGYLQRLVSKLGGLVPQHKSPRGPGAAAPGGFLGGPGGYSLTSKNSPPGGIVSPGDVPDPALGRGIPSAGDASAQEAVLPLLRQLRQAQWTAGFVQGQRRQLAVALPEAAPAAPALSAEELDLACERDARRYGGGFALY